MTNSKSTKRALLTSALAMLMCVAMLIGTTFAWFTDTASTAVNKIQSGTLDVALEMNAGTTAEPNWVSAEGKTLQFKVNGQIPEEGTQILLEPGCTYELPELRVVNKGNLALKYKILITGIKGDAKLNEAIEWTISDTALDFDHSLAANATSGTLTIKGHMKEEVGNEYQDLSIDGISISVYATQDTVEYDSKDNQYDDVDLWDGTVATAAELAAATNNEQKTVTISSAKLLAAFAKAVNDGNDYNGYTINLTKNIELCDIPWTPIGEKAGTKFKGTFGGGSKTIGGLNVTSATVGEDHDGYGAFFGAIENGTVKNLTVGGTVNCKNAAGIVARMDGGTIENCISSVNVTGTLKAGGIVCMTHQDTCTIKNCTNNGQIDLTETTNQYSHRPVGGIVGLSNTCTVENCINNGKIGSVNAAFSGGIIGCTNMPANYTGVKTRTVTGSTNNGNVTGYKYTAGIIGLVKEESATVKSCTNAGTIDAGSGEKGDLYTKLEGATVTTE